MAPSIEPIAPPHPGRRATFALGLAAIAALLVAAAASPEAADGRGNPFADEELFVDPDSNARAEIGRWAVLRPFDALAMRRIASHSHADWFGDWNRDVRRAVRDRVAQIRRAGALPVLVAYNVPNRDCTGGYSAGGARSPRAYRKWIRRFAAGIGRREAAVILEPDALASLGCLREGERRSRLRLLRDAVNVLAERTQASIYIDAGHSGWMPARTMCDRLRRAGVRRARGFSLNVSNFRRTSTERAYGRKLGRGLPRRHFVIDVSRNGLGPAPGGEWCNPPGRALGGPPTARTGEPLVDAYLWVKPPGESDGTCNGGPRAGEWWAEYALGLAERAPWVD